MLGQRHAFDFIEKQCAAVGVLELADALAGRPGERAALVAEQLGLEQLLGDGRAVECDKGLVGPRPEVVQATRDQFLAATGFAANQHVDRQCCQVQNLPTQGLQTPRHAEQRGIQFGAVVRLLVQRAVLQNQPALVEGAAQAAEQGFRAEGFFEEIVGTVAHGFDGHRYIAVTGQQDHRQIGIPALHLGQQFQAGHAGHAHIAENHPGKMPGQLRQAFIGAAEQLHLETRQAQPLLDGTADAAFVVDHHH
ncbi:hypothetical protein D3C85_1013460 [compost metagenome]